MTSPDKRFARDARISWRIIEDEAILIDHDEREVMRLNPVGAEIWEGLDGTRTVNEIIDYIYHTFEVDRNRARKDVLRFLKELARREMVEETPGDGRRPS